MNTHFGSSPVNNFQINSLLNFKVLQLLFDVSMFPILGTLFVDNGCGYYNPL